MYYQDSNFIEAFVLSCSERLIQVLRCSHLVEADANVKDLIF